MIDDAIRLWLDRHVTHTNTEMGRMLKCRDTHAAIVAHLQETFGLTKTQADLIWHDCVGRTFDYVLTLDFIERKCAEHKQFALCAHTDIDEPCRNLAKGSYIPYCHKHKPLHVV